MCNVAEVANHGDKCENCEPKGEGSGSHDEESSEGHGDEKASEM